MLKSPVIFAFGNQILNSPIGVQNQKLPLQNQLLIQTVLSPHNVSSIVADSPILDFLDPVRLSNSPGIIISPGFLNQKPETRNEIVIPPRSEAKKRKGTKHEPKTNKNQRITQEKGKHIENQSKLICDQSIIPMKPLPLQPKAKTSPGAQLAEIESNPKKLSPNSRYPTRSRSFIKKK